MGLREKMFSRIFSRSILTQFGQRTPYSFKTREFVPYFKYKIGPYEQSYVLYFKRRPSLGIYKNEIFNKMYEYSGYDIARYLEFHYDEFEDKKDFIRFLSYEVSERIKVKTPAAYRLNLQSTQKWLSEKQGDLVASPEQPLKFEVENKISFAPQVKMPNIVINPPLTPSSLPPVDLESVAQSFADKISSRMDQVICSTEEKFSELTDSFITGNIELNNNNYLEKLIQLHILIQSIKPSEGPSEEKLFKRNSSTDLASLLHLHFRAFKDKKFNTVQVKITECGDRLKINDPKVQKLTKALTEFFY